jgi:hypothetical protein
MPKILLFLIFKGPQLKFNFKFSPPDLVSLALLEQLIKSDLQVR